MPTGNGIDASSSYCTIVPRDKPSKIESYKVTCNGYSKLNETIQGNC